MQYLRYQQKIHWKKIKNVRLQQKLDVIRCIEIKIYISYMVLIWVYCVIFNFNVTYGTLKLVFSYWRTSTHREIDPESG